MTTTAPIPRFEFQIATADFHLAKLALSYPSPFSGEGRPQRSGGRGGGDVRMCSAGRPPPDTSYRCAHDAPPESELRSSRPHEDGGGMKTRDVIASASEAIHGSASQDRRWIASSQVLLAMTSASSLRKQGPILRVSRLTDAVR